MACMCLLPLGVAHAQDESHAMCVNLADGKVDTYVVKEQLKVSLLNGEVNVTSSTLSTVYDVDDVVNYTFLNVATGIDDGPLADKDADGIKVVYLDNETVAIYGTDADGVKVYSAGGVSVKADATERVGGVAVSLRSLPAGTYIISINKEKSVKVVKK